MGTSQLREAEADFDEAFKMLEIARLMGANKDLVHMIGVRLLRLKVLIGELAKRKLSPHS